MDGLMLRCLIGEWQQFINHRVEKIHQPSERDLVLTLRGKSGTARVLLSAHRQFFRVHQLTQERPSNPQEPPMFCMLARKHLEGGRITRIVQQGLDRVLEIHVDSFNELGDAVTYVLVVELMGKHSNIMVCVADSDGQPSRIIDSIVRVSRDMSRVRPILPGGTYVRPPHQAKVSVWSLTKDALAHLDWTSDAAVLAKKMPSAIEGVGPITAQEALHRANVSEVSPSKFVQSLQSLANDLNSGHLEPTLGLDALGRPVAAAPFRLTSFADCQPFSSYDAALEEFYHATASRNLTGAAHSDLKRQLEQVLDRLRAKRTKITRELEKSLGHEEERIQGEILTAFASQVEPGSRQVTLPNFYEDNRPETIQLNPDKTAIENAQDFFRRAKKRKRAVQLLEGERTAVKHDIEYLEGCLLIVDDAELKELEELRMELVQQEFLRARRKERHNPKKTANSASKYMRLQSSDGYQILVGRNNSQNDMLTFRRSQADDLWFHVKDQPGSHVVVRSSGEEVPTTTIEEAAVVAAYFSKGRDSSNVAVDYTRIRHVWKPSGARPGFALYKEQKTLFVTPHRSVIKDLEQSSENNRDEQE